MVVSTRLGEHINSHSLQDNLLSAYRTCHSTETALLRVHHDIAYALDNNQCAVLVMVQSKDNIISICCSFNMHATITSKSKDWL